MDLALITKFFISLLAITNPLGNSAIFCGMVGSQSQENVRKIAIKTAISSFIILAIAAVAGNNLLNLFGISMPAFRIAGGIIVLLIGLTMVRGEGHSSHHEDGEDAADIAVVPLSIPLVAGPGTLATVIIFSSHYALSFHNMSYIFGAIFAAMVIIGLVFMIAPLLFSKLGPRGAKIITRVMGLFLSAIAIDICLAGLQTSGLFA